MLMETLVNFWQKYDGILPEAAVLLIGLLGVILLARMLRQIKRLNKNLGNITGNVQAYMDVILKEETEYEEDSKAETMQAQTEEKERRETKEAAMELEQEQQKIEDEALFNAVLQEYFS